MKVLFLSSWYPNKDNILDGNFVHRHANAISKYCNIQVLAIKSSFSNEKFIETKISKSLQTTTTIIYYKQYSNKILRYFAKSLAYIYSFKFITTFDIIHVNIMFPTLFWGVFLKIIYNKKLVVTEHWTIFIEENKIGFLQKIFYKLFGSFIDIVLPVSQNLGNGIKSYGIKCPQIIVPNVVDTDIFYPQNDNYNNIYTFIHVSSLNDEQKNISGIINAFKSLSDKNIDFRLKIIGSNYKNYIHLVKTLNLQEKIFLYDIQVPNDIANNLRLSDCLVMFSNYENQPCIISEAISCGTDLITTDVGGIKEFLPELYDSFVECNNIGQLSELLESKINNKRVLDKDLLFNFAKDNFSIDNIGFKIYSIYKSLI